MSSGLAIYERQAATLQRQIDQIELATVAQSLPPRSATDLATDLNIHLDPWQERVLSSTAKRLIVLGPRQTGKSTVSGLLSLHVAVTKPEALVLLIAPSLRQSAELARVVRRLAATLGVSTAEVSPSAVSMTRIEFSNGARVIALPGTSETTVRGFAKPDIIVCDEASRIAEETYAALRPALSASPDGRLVLVSTPWLKSGTFHHTWTGDSPVWERFRVKTTDCPRLSAEFLAEERRSLPPWVFNREYLGEFSDDDTTLFSAELIAAALDPTVKPLFPIGGVA